MSENVTDKTREQIREIFFEIYKKKTPHERSQYLDEVCGMDVGLRGELESLLEAHDRSGNLLENLPIVAHITLNEPTLSEAPGTVINKYKLLEKIGEGGMAVVYMAEQQEPIRRKVALKIIKLGMDTKSVIARFEAERQALAMMDHPNIAKVLDAGATETGRPYFVMELVQGVSVTEYCDHNKLSTDERLALFIQVCQAVQHAHQKGIIHRDIKPSNIMVAMHNGEPMPKVIDFGIAKATNQRLTEKTLFTRYAHIIGTPAYMSPEQAELSDVDIDTRSDIYSLGVLLYELLTGMTPFSEEKLRNAGYLEMHRVIREEEPTKPSTKLSTLGATLSEVARQRRVTPDSLRKLIRGDLDWIVMKTLEKARSGRYDTASALSTDIQRHLNDEPILARAPKVTYRLQKYFRRHRSQTIVSAAMVILIATVIITLFMWNRYRFRLSIAEAPVHKNILSVAQQSFVKGDYAAALVSVRTVVDSRHIGVEARLLCANILVDCGRPDEAKPMLEDLLEESPEIAGAAHLLLARILLETESSDSERFAKIAEHGQKADELLPETAQAYFLRAMITISIKKKLEYLNEALRLDRGHYESRRLRAYTYYASRKYEQMEEDASAMTALRSEDPLGYSLRAFALRELGDFEEAITEYDIAIGLTSEGAQRTKLYEQRCEMYLRMGQYEKAITNAEEGLKGSSNGTMLQFQIFCALTALGEYDKTSTQFHDITDSDTDANRIFRNWSKKHVFDTLEAGRSWHSPDIKPKGAAFVSMLEAADIYHNLVAKNAWRVTTDGYTAEWSPDRTKMAFSMGVHGYSGLAVFDPNTQETELFMVPGAAPKWSPDGQYIAFVRDCRTLRLSELTAVERRRHNRPKVDSEVWIIHADGTKPRRLARGGSLSWSQDSKHVYYRSDETFYSISIEDEEARPQPVFAFQGYIRSLSPDKKKLAYARPGWLKIVDTASKSLIAQWTGPLRIWGGNWSPGSNQFSLGGFRNPVERTGLWIYDLNTNKALKVFSGHIINATWAPDETALAFCFGPPFYEIWSVDLDPNLSTVESLGPARTLQQHHQEMVDLYTGRINANPEEATSYLHRSTYYHYLNEKDKALADIRKYADIYYPTNEINSRNAWVKNLLIGLSQKPPANLGSPVNSPAWDSPGSMSSDGLRLYLHSRRPGGFGKEDIYVARRATTSDPWAKPENLGDNINTSYTDYEPDISADGLTLLFVSDRPGGSGSDDIWITKRTSLDAPWGKPVNLGPTINSAALDMDPSTTADGLTLYFSSRRSGGIGSYDIWVSKRASTKEPWGEPVNLGAPVNSRMTDSCPDISADGLTLFFLSFRLDSLGQSDLYVTTRPTIHDPWGPAVNLGPNINTHNTEEYPKISFDGRLFMFVADKPEGVGQLDIWQVDISTMPADSIEEDTDVD